MSAPGATTIQLKNDSKEAAKEAAKLLYSEILGIEWRMEGEQKYPHLVQVCEKLFHRLQRSAAGAQAYRDRLDEMKKVSDPL